MCDRLLENIIRTVQNRTRARPENMEYILFDAAKMPAAVLGPRQQCIFVEF